MKRKLIDIVEDYKITWEEGLDIVTNHLSEDMVTGANRLLWINEVGQEAIDNIIPIPKVFRGRVIGELPNPKFVQVRCPDIVSKVLVMIPPKMQGRIMGKIICFTSEGEGDQMRYVHKDIS